MHNVVFIGGEKAYVNQYEIRSVELDCDMYVDRVHIRFKDGTTLTLHGNDASSFWANFKYHHARGFQK